MLMMHTEQFVNKPKKCKEIYVSTIPAYLDSNIIDGGLNVLSILIVVPNSFRLKSNSNI